MNELKRIESALLDDDGSCRDVNFLAPSWDGVAQFIKFLEQKFGERSAINAEGNSLVEPHWRKVKSSVLETGPVYLKYRDSFEVFNNLQIFVAEEADGSAFIELTFFPEDLARVNNLARDFIAWVETAKAILQASRYFCRYENASWSFGDTSRASGVFFTSREPN